jgi:hypothetical protein
MVERMTSVIALAGRRIDAADAAPRFPPASVARVRRNLRDLFHSHGADSLFCAAACGADLIALEVAEELRIPAWIVLPFPPPLFRASSVVDRPGDWGPSFDAQLRLAVQSGRLIVHDMKPGDDNTYLQANESILDAAIGHASGDEAAAVIVWEGKPRDGIDVTYAFAQSARSRGLPVLEIST